jgi:saccharopine dehydrogenase (NAD+, L-lysine-forming)
MSKVLIIGAGGVGGVVTHKCAMNADVFTDITAREPHQGQVRQDRRRGQGDAWPCRSTPRALDADDVAADRRVAARAAKPALLINVALPYQDLPLMDACLEAGVPYLDTANYEPKDVAKFEYSWQWAYRERFEAGRTDGAARLGLRSRRHATSHRLRGQAPLRRACTTSTSSTATAGDHGKAFATNFNPEINIREITQKGRYWQDGEWIEIPSLSEHKPIDFPGVGPRESYVLYHEELESLVAELPDA